MWHPADWSMRGKKLGKRMVSKLLDRAREQGCYKVILDCKEHNIGFYTSCGFKVKDAQMSCYFSEVVCKSTSWDTAAARAQADISLGDSLVMTSLRADHFHQGFAGLLEQLTSVGELSEDMYRARLAELQNSMDALMFVIEDTSLHRVVGVGTLLIEHKFIHSAGRCGHIEDIVVDCSQRGRGLGKKMVTHLKKVARLTGCYKAILNCTQQNVPFYEKCGFVETGVSMALYLT
mmetsp:Transcript_27583/g.71572  ORF Transcript_27583/g.71572 Transcript_27583/m.71572 type:complete len:233 (+) Transcript_27583:240-938(+)